MSANEHTAQAPCSGKRWAMIPREKWCHHAVDTEERQCIIEEIRYWLTKISTLELVTVLAKIANQADDFPLREPFIEVDAESPLEGLIAVDDIDAALRQINPSGEQEGQSD